MAYALDINAASGPAQSSATDYITTTTGDKINYFNGNPNVDKWKVPAIVFGVVVVAIVYLKTRK